MITMWVERQTERTLSGPRFVKAGTMDDSSWVTIDSSFWSSTAEPWSPVDTNSPVFEKNPTSLG